MVTRPFLSKSVRETIERHSNRPVLVTPSVTKPVDVISNKPVINELPHTIPNVSVAIPTLVKNVSISPALLKNPIAFSPSVIEKILNVAPSSGLDAVKAVEIKNNPVSQINVEEDMSLKSVFNKVKKGVGKVLPIAAGVTGAILAGPGGAAAGSSIGQKLGGALNKAKNIGKSVGIFGLNTNPPSDLAPVAKTPNAVPSKTVGLLRTNSSVLSLANVLKANEPNFSENADRPGLRKEDSSGIIKIIAIGLLVWVGCKALKIC